MIEGTYTDTQDTAEYTGDRFMALAKWKEEFNFKFRKCKETGKTIWPFTKAFRGTVTTHGPGTPVIDQNWLTGPTYTYLKLTGKVR